MLMSYTHMDITIPDQ